MKEAYTIVEFMEDKEKMEDEIKELRKQRDELSEKIEEKEEKYTEFVNAFLFRGSKLEAKIDFSEME
jgi:uncharacterized coiled-coil DUF342 family protein